MPKAQITKDVLRKYVLVDTPLFSKGTEGVKYIYKRNQDQSTSFAIKKFFLKPLMRIEAKKQIAQIIETEKFKEIPEAQALLKKIKNLPFWKGVEAQDVLNISELANFLGIMRLIESGETASVTSHKTTHADHLNDQNALSDSYGSDEEFSSDESDYDVAPDDFKNNVTPEQSKKEINQETPKEKIIRENAEKKLTQEIKDRKEIEQEELKKETEVIEIMQSIQQDELVELTKQTTISQTIEQENLKKDINPDNLKRDIRVQLEQKFNSNEDHNKNIYEGLNELVSYINDPNKECGFEVDKKITIFMKAIIVLENENDRFPLKLSNEITKLHEWYTDKYTDARAKGNIAEINKVMHPESEKSEIDEKQIKLAEEMRKKLWEIPVLARNPNELNAFIDYFKNPASSFSVDRKNDYAEFLSLFYKNINQLDKQAQTQCLNVADRLEGSMQDDDAIGFQFFDDAQMDNKSQEVFDLMDSLREHDVPSSSLLRFFYYLKNGKETIDPKSYWQLLQFLANQQSAMEVNLRPDQLVFFKKVLQDLRTDLGNYRTKNKIQQITDKA